MYHHPQHKAEFIIGCVFMSCTKKKKKLACPFLRYKGFREVRGTSNYPHSSLKPELSEERHHEVFTKKIGFLVCVWVLDIFFNPVLKNWIPPLPGGPFP
jgi:hypothetical protein